MYSVFRNHVTAGTTCDELEPPAELLTNSEDPVESPNRDWSFGSNFGRFFGSGFSAIKRNQENAFASTLSHETQTTQSGVGGDRTLT